MLEADSSHSEVFLNRTFPGESLIAALLHLEALVLKTGPWSKPAIGRIALEFGENLGFWDAQAFQTSDNESNLKLTIEKLAFLNSQCWGLSTGGE